MSQQNAFKLQVVTYNIHKGFSIGNTRFVLHQMREALQNTDVDLIFLQEIQGKHTRRENSVKNWPEQTQAAFLAEESWPHSAYGMNAVYKAGHHGNAILSKYPINRWENINVSPTRFASRSLLHGCIEIPNNPLLHVICIHFGLVTIEQKRQLDVLCDRIHSHVPNDAPLIIAGDFNDWTGLAQRTLMKNLGLNEVFHSLTQRSARTYPVWLPLLSIDKIFYRGATAESCQCLKKLPWRKLSDHAALYATFSFGLQ